MGRNSKMLARSFQSSGAALRSHVRPVCAIRSAGAGTAAPGGRLRAGVASSGAHRLGFKRRMQLLAGCAYAGVARCGSQKGANIVGQREALDAASSRPVRIREQRWPDVGAMQGPFDPLPIRPCTAFIFPVGQSASPPQCQRVPRGVLSYRAPQLIDRHGRRQSVGIVKGKVVPGCRDLRFHREKTHLLLPARYDLRPEQTDRCASPPR